MTNNRQTAIKSIICDVDCVLSIVVSHSNRVIIAICKHIVSNKTMSRSSIGIRIDESADVGIIISALEVVEPGISIVVVAP